MEEANRLAVGPMGFSGKTSLIGCKIGALNRLPASFFVSVAYDCWAFRRLGVHLDAASGAITSWLYRDGDAPSTADARARGGRRRLPAHRAARSALQAPISEEQIRALKVGDVVLVSGRVYTGRDAVHAHLMKHEPPVDLRGGVLYHCGPVVAKEGDGWRVTAAGPTTSIREEPYQADILKRYGVRVVIGKGGMGAKTLAGLEGVGRGLPERDRRRGAVLRALHRARRRRVADGVRHAGGDVAPRRCATFPAIVTMDAHGNSLHKDVEEASGQVLATLAIVAARTSVNASPGRSSIASSARRSRRRRSRSQRAMPHHAAAVRVERLEVAERLRALQDRERIAGLRNLGLRLVVCRDHERDDGVRPALVILAGRVQVARSDAEGAWRRRVLLPDALADRRDARPRRRASAGRYDRNAT